MSVVKINAITIPEGMGAQLEGRFAGRAKMVEQFDGFEDFQLLRPTEGEERYFVYTRWASEAHFQAWMESQDFAKGHGTGQADGNTNAEGEQARKPVAQGADLMSFDVVEHVVKGEAGCSCGPDCPGGDQCPCNGSCDCGPDCNCGCCN